MLDHEHKGNFTTNRGDDYMYMAGDINGHNVIIAKFPAGHDHGVGSAAALASQVKKSFPNLWFGLLVGVAASLLQKTFSNGSSHHVQSVKRLTRNEWRVASDRMV
jgi:hypothetical protein